MTEPGRPIPVECLTPYKSGASLAIGHFGWVIAVEGIEAKQMIAVRWARPFVKVTPIAPGVRNKPISRGKLRKAVRTV